MVDTTAGDTGTSGAGKADVRAGSRVSRCRPGSRNRAVRAALLSRDPSYTQVLQLVVLVLLVLVQLLQELVLAVLQQPAMRSSPTSAYS
jgi:hypothetical protein